MEYRIETGSAERLFAITDIVLRRRSTVVTVWCGDSPVAVVCDQETADHMVQQPRKYPCAHCGR